MEIIDKSAAREAWRCCGPCDQLMYSKKLIDGEYYPVAGAPQAYYISVLYPRVCSTCFLLYTQLADSNYWKEIQEQMKEDRRRAKKLRSGEDYLSA